MFCGGSRRVCKRKPAEIEPQPLKRQCAASGGFVGIPHEECTPPPQEKPPDSTTSKPSPILAKLPKAHIITKNAWIDAAYNVSKRGLTEEHFEQHRQWLTVQPRSYTTKPAEPVKFFTETSQEFSVPRAYGLARWGMPLKDCTSVGEEVEVAFAGTLTLVQEEVCDCVMRQFLEKDRLHSCMICMDTGMGKTVVAINLFTRLGRKTLFVVHTDDLLEQAVERIEQYAPTARVGILRQKKAEVEGRDIVVATIQSLVCHDYEDGLLESFGLMIMDETHHIAAPWFSKLCRKVSSRYVLGMSATPRRKDGLTHVLYWLMGPVVIEKRRNITSGNLQVVVRTVRFEGRTMKRIQSANFKALMITRLTFLQYRNERIANDIAHLYVSSLDGRPRKTLVLSHRLQHLDTLRDLILERVKNMLAERDSPRKASIDKTAENCYRLLAQNTDDEDSLLEDVPEVVFAVGYRVGGLSKEAKRAAVDCNVILATMPIAEEGLDIPTLDTLAITTPMSDVQQCIGRLLRECPEKNNCLVLDYWDMFEPFSDMNKARMAYCRSRGYAIEEVHA